ncbi:hypothetical protein EET67_19065 [Pseudaminobacter arsenicus]|uniref:DUF5666 domain-containing protein n=1 Tax=Borborobacter arsenicus TaxID=1851146 RepID=A0A432V2C3_9HYPH|nr:DUF6152 family protein [Pseudaminobacter arsenicus]RUM96265.1 hypothetical protein EET67_19065 [Pseudaminobacter arsenicus]
MDHAAERLTRRTLFACILAAAWAGPALAHHGWDWTEDEFFEIEGRITAIYIGNPHATLDVDVDGMTWRVELAPPRATVNAGFTEDVARVGDEVKAVGHRSLDETERRMKAVRIIVRDQTYDVYPDRVPSN